MVIEARAPLEQMFGYSSSVRSLSQGRAGYTMEPLEYAPAPDSLLESIAGY
jgi:elongation factor G